MDHPSTKTDWKPWLPPAFDQHDERRHGMPGRGPDQDSVDQASESDLAAAALQALREQAMRQAQEEGREQGFAQGFEQGYEQGFAKGQEEGIAQGTEQGLEQGRLAGFEQGHASGHEQGMRDAHLEVQAVQRLADATCHAIDEAHQTIGQSVVELAVVLARQILARELRTPHSELVPLVRNIIEHECQNAERVTLRVHPDDRERLHTALQADAPARQWQVVADASLNPGDCVVQTPLGQVDAQMRTRWQRMVRALGVHPGLAQYESDSEPDSDPGHTGSSP